MTSSTRGLGLGKRKYKVFNKISNIRKNVYAREDDKYSLGHVEFEVSLVPYAVQTLEITPSGKSGMKIQINFFY